jgi:hypothetical protein
MLKSVKFKRLFTTGRALVLAIPKLWIKDLTWTKETKLVLEYHPYKKEIIVMEDYRNISPQLDKEVEVEIDPILKFEDEE